MPADPASPTLNRHIDAARTRLAHLAGLDAGTEAAERRIRDAAAKRLEQVEADLAKAQRRALAHDGAAQHYVELTQERARLLDVMARANDRLGEAAR